MRDSLLAPLCLAKNGGEELEGATKSLALFLRAPMETQCCATSQLLAQTARADAQASSRLSLYFCALSCQVCVGRTKAVYVVGESNLQPYFLLWPFLPSSVLSR